jgi:DNA polymerase-3 subunit beta
VKISIEAGVLAREMAVIREYTANSAASILAYVLFEAEGETVSLSATDVRSGITIRLPCDVIEEGRAVINADKLLKAIKTLNNCDVTIDCSDSTAVVKGPGKARFKIKTLASDKFPEGPEPVGDPVVLIGEDFSRLVKNTAFAVSDDATRYFMNGIFFEKGEDGKLQSVATDGRRLALMSSNVEIPESPNSIIPPQRLISASKIVGTKEEMKLYFGPKSIFLSFGYYNIWTVLIDGQFPNYRRVIPENQTNSFTTNRVELLYALKRAMVMIDDNPRIYLTVTPEGIKVKAEDSLVGEAEDEIPVKYSGEEVVFAFNCKYPTEALETIDNEKVTVCFTESERAITMESDTWLHVIMPMQSS